MYNNDIKLDRIDRLVMICTGNICRSPMAWGIGLRETKKRGLALAVESAGTGACVGYGASANSVTACSEIGIDLSAHVARQVDIGMYTSSTLFVVMTPNHAQWLTAVVGIPEKNVVMLGRGIPDPYGQSVEVYRTTRDAIEEALIRLFDRIEPLTEHVKDDEADDSTIVIRPAELGDIDAIAAIEADCFTDPWSADSFAREIGSTVSVLITAELCGELCGYAVAYTVGDAAEIPKICVKPEMRRQGVAGRLLEWIEQEAVSLGCTELTLEVRRSNEAAQKLYDKHGFEYVGIRPGFYSHPAEDAVIMIKRL